MNYRLQALILGVLLFTMGGWVLLYSVLLSQVISVVGGSILVFMGLGLILIGSLIMFASPHTLVASDIVSRVLSPSAKNLDLILRSLDVRSEAIHVPKVKLGEESQVLLVISRIRKLPKDRLDDPFGESVLGWQDDHRVLIPVGIELMRGYEEKLKRDFFGIDIEQLGRLLSRAIVPEFQLCSGFSLRVIPDGFAEATWTKPAVTHSCVLEAGIRHPELCCLCSSVACALAKATGKPVKIEKSDSIESGLRVRTIYRVSGV